MRATLQMFRDRSLKEELSIVRAFINFSAVFLTLLCIQHAQWYQAAFIATITASWAAAMQFWNRQYLDWLSGTHWFGLHSSQKASLGQSYSKKFLSSSIYAILIYLGMLASGFLHWQGVMLALGRVISTSAESLFTQTAWQRNNHDWKSAAIARNPDKTLFIENLSGVASLVQSTIVVLANVLNVSGNGLGDFISFSVGISGILFFIYVRNQRSEIADPILAAS